MTGVFPGGGWAGHPDLVGRAAAVLKVTAVGRDPLRAAAHGGGSDRVSSGLLMGDERNAQSLAVVFLHFTSPLHLVCTPGLTTQPQVLYCPLPARPPALSQAARSMSPHLGNVEPLLQIRPDLSLRYLPAACEEQSVAVIVADGIGQESFCKTQSNHISLPLIRTTMGFAGISLHPLAYCPLQHWAAGMEAGSSSSQ